MALLQSDLKDHQETKQHLLQDIELLKGDRDNNRDLKECIEFL